MRRVEPQERVSLGRRSQQTSPALLGIHSLRDTNPDYNTLKAQRVTKGALVDIVAEEQLQRQ